MCAPSQGAEQFNDFLAASRVLVNLLPSRPETANVMNKDTLGRLQPGAYVINVARGAHLVEEDLLALIDSGHVAGATLDVFRTEPLPCRPCVLEPPPHHHHPHTSARTLRDESIAQIARKMAALERGEAVAGIVNPHAAIDCACFPFVEAFHDFLHPLSRTPHRRGPRDGLQNEKTPCPPPSR